VATVNLTKDDFAQTIQDNDLVLVDFWAEWCGPCKRFGPIFEQVSDEMPDSVFAKVDTDANQELAGGLGIQAIPTLMVFRKGALVYREAGAINASQLKKLIDQAKALDIDKLKAEAASAKPSTE